MKQAPMPQPSGLPPELEAQVQQVLHEGESVDDFVGLAVQRLVALRRARQLATASAPPPPAATASSPGVLHAADDLLAQLQAWRSGGARADAGEAPAGEVSGTRGGSPSR